MYTIRLRDVVGLMALVFIAALPACSPSQILAGAQLNCALASDGATVVAVLKPGYAAPANAASVVGCDAGTRIGAALAATK